VHQTTFPARTISVEDQGHAFRGRFIDQCCYVEAWAARLLGRPDIEASLPPRTPTYLFGQKLQAIGHVALADQESDGKKVLKNPKAVLKLLRRFEPYANLRSALAHAILTVRISADGTFLFVYTPASGQKWSAVVLTEAAQTQILGAAAHLAKLFEDQHPRRTA
jgi:hypothetical protein